MLFLQGMLSVTFPVALTVELLFMVSIMLVVVLWVSVTLLCVRVRSGPGWVLLNLARVMLVVLSEVSMCLSAFACMIDFRLQMISVRVQLCEVSLVFAWVAMLCLNMIRAGTEKSKLPTRAFSGMQGDPTGTSGVTASVCVWVMER